MAKLLRIFVFLGVLLVLGTIPSGSIEAQQTFQQALPGYNYQFPKDLYAHEDFRIEWWYYTGNLTDAASGRFGYQLTFFRVALDPQAPKHQASRWAIDHIYFAHMTVTDAEGGRFHFFERINRRTLDQAGAASDRLKVWNEDWELTGEGDVHHLVAQEKGVGFDLKLTPVKPVVIHGRDGISQKGSESGNASHYFSYTRMKTEGTVILDGKSHAVTGTSWMDREYSSNQLSSEQIGWDWFSLKMGNNEELMLYQIRLKDGGIEPNSSGSWIGADGWGQHLQRNEFQIEVLDTWKSEITGAVYPSAWKIKVPGRKGEITVSPEMPDQELYRLRSISSSYWEGSVRFEGTIDGRPVSGRGYVELVGYQKNLVDALPK